MTEQITGFIFNDEFLIENVQKRRFEEQFGSEYLSIFGNDKVTGIFLSADRKAIEAKNQFYMFGMLVVVCASVALVFAALDVSFLLYLENSFSEDVARDWKPVLKIFAVISAVLGVAAFVVGVFGFRIKKVRRRYVEYRMLAELIRLWRADFLLHGVTCVSDELSSTELNSAINKLEGGLGKFVEEIEVNKTAILADFVSSGGGERFEDWLVGRKLGEEDGHGINAECLDAYRRVRMGSQYRYSSFVISSDASFRVNPKQQIAFFESVSYSAVAGIAFIHALVIAGFLFDVGAFTSYWLHSSTIVLAILALSVASIERGINPHTHLSRYERYNSVVRRLMRDFDEAVEPVKKKSVAEEFEKVAFEELREFLLEAKRSHFVL